MQYEITDFFHSGKLVGRVAVEGRNVGITSPDKFTFTFLPDLVDTFSGSAFGTGCVLRELCFCCRNAIVDKFNCVDI